MNVIQRTMSNTVCACLLFILVLGALLIQTAGLNIHFPSAADIGSSAKNNVPLMMGASGNTNPQVVELFTSEGCSRCPPADQLLAVTQKHYKDDVIVLSYHVDYWDRLGWKDSFSKSIFSDRQRLYAMHLKNESVYTPQAIVNGKAAFVGSNKKALWNAINNFKTTNHNIVETDIPLLSNEKLSVKYYYAGLQTNEKVVMQLVLKGSSTNVKQGENSGATLHHINIVRDIAEKKESKGTIAFTLPPDFIKEKYFVVAFIQNQTTYEINVAKEISIY